MVEMDERESALSSFDKDSLSEMVTSDSDPHEISKNIKSAQKVRREKIREKVKAKHELVFIIFIYIAQLKKLFIFLLF